MANPLVTLLLFTVGCAMVGLGVGSWLVGIGLWLAGMGVVEQIQIQMDAVKRSEKR